jgi:hypothetical protein
MLSRTNNEKVYIIILNWNQKNDTLECLDSLQKTTYRNYKIVVVDNGSIDNSQKEVKNLYPEVVLIENKTNLGYAEGNNTGIRYALKQGADYIFILNNDTIIDKEALNFLVKEAKKDRNTGIVGPVVYFYNNPNRIQSAGEMFDKNWNHISPGIVVSSEDISYISGCAMLVKKEVFEKIGFFDPQFFMYWEETDFCYRAKKAGFKITIAPQAKVWHKGGMSSTPLITYYMTRNKLLFLKKHKLGSLNILKTYISSLRTTLSWSIKPRWKHKREERNMLVRALCDFCIGKTGK